MDERENIDTVDSNLGMSRRTLLRRGAIVGGSLVWAAPAVQSFSRAALAQDNGTPCVFCVGVPGTDDFLGYCETQQTCCDCLENPENYGGNCEDECVALQCFPGEECPV